MAACTVQYVACGGAVIMYRLAETRAGSPSHLVLKGYAAFQRPFLPGVSSENGILVRSSIGWNTMVVGWSVLGAIVPPLPPLPPSL